MYDDCELTLNKTHKINMEGSSLNTEFKYNSWSFYDETSINNFQKNKYFYKIFKKNNPPQIHNTIFTTPCNSNHYNIRDMIDTLKIENSHDEIEIVLGKVFGISNIDIIKNKVMLKENGTFKDLNYFGDGLKYFLHIILVLLVNKDTVVYLDEVENGIHYTNLDNLWRIILKISKDNNIQVFATTHSKECIESYARVAKRLKDEEITFLDMGRKKDGSVAMITMDSKQFQDEIEMTNEVRGW